MNTLQTEVAANTQQERLFYLDWVRVLAVLGVFFFHTVLPFDYLSDWLVKNTQRSLVATAFITFFFAWGIPLFFVLAGAASWFALRTRTRHHFLRERGLRLLVPLFVGLVLFSIPQAYVDALTHGRFAGSFFQFVPWFFAHIQISWHLWWIVAYTYHLWFLAFLMLFTLIALPLFVYLRGAAGQRVIDTLAAWCSKPGGIFLFIVPIALIQMSLRAAFPMLYDWADFVFYFAFFVYGYLLFSRPSFAEAIRRHGWIGLGIGLLCFFLLVATNVAANFAPMASPSYSIGSLLYQLLRSINTWAWLVFMLACGMRWLNVKNNVLSYSNEAVLPFFVVHHPVIVLVAFYVVQWNMGMGLKWLIISTLALVLTLSVYELLIRRVKPMRWLFGMKPSSRTPQEETKDGGMQLHEAEAKDSRASGPVFQRTQEEAPLK